MMRRPLIGMIGQLSIFPKSPFRQKPGRSHLDTR